jgi:2-amino-4-hydroxy-6-hydroxymethyldihydropteridine diphosphokinase
MVECFLALGSNLGDRKTHLSAAIEGLAQRGVRVLRCASLYTTEPKEFHPQPWVLNTAVKVLTDASPEMLMHECLAIEESQGRQRVHPNGPRTLDIDIILFGDHIVRTENLTIPHPRYTERRFVLEPLAEIAADIVDPVRGESIRHILSQNVDRFVVRWYAPPLL